MRRGDRGEEIFREDGDRQDFLKTLAETCQKTGFEVHAYCLMLWYLAAAQHRPGWIRVGRVLGEHGIRADTAEGRRELEARWEARRRQEEDEAAWEPLRRGWCLGSAAFRKERLERMEGELGEAHAGELRRESAEARAERIIAAELRREGWRGADLTQRRKGDPVKLALAARLRRETTLTVGWIAARLKMGTRQSTATRLQEFKRQRPTGSGK